MRDTWEQVRRHIDWLQDYINNNPSLPNEEIELCDRMLLDLEEELLTAP